MEASEDPDRVSKVDFLRNPIGAEGDAANLPSLYCLGAPETPRSTKGCKRHGWSLPAHARGILRLRSVVVALSVFAVLILLTSSTGTVRAETPTGSSSPAVQTSQPSTPPPFYPYITNTSAWPEPDVLRNITGALSLPQVSTLQAGSTFVYVIALVDQIPSQGTVLEFDTGRYDPGTAQLLAQVGGCFDACDQHLPIVWDLPTPVAAYGGSPIQGDALAVSQSGDVFLAASSNNSTQVYESQSLGAAGSWFALSGETSIAGGNPGLAATASGCEVVLTTHRPGKTLVTTFSKTCVLVGLSEPEGHEGDGPQVLLPPGGASAEAYGAVPSQAPAGYSVDVYGTGFGGVQSVRFGTVATTFTYVSPTEVRATVPGGAGTESVQVEVSNIWTPANCSTEFTYGNALTSGTPQVAWISRNTSSAGAQVTVYGFNFQSGDAVYFGSVRAGGTVTSANTIVVTVPSPSGSPTVNVTVKDSSLTSPTTCADLFHYLGPYISSISPTSGWMPLTVILHGTNFSSGASVYFGPNASATVTHVSSTELKATLPSGLGAVAVTVHQSGYTSNSITFTYTPPTPVVTAIVPDQGPDGAGVTIWGQNLNASSSVYFGSHLASTTQHLSTSTLQVAAPSGTGTVNVTVHQFGKVSASVCSDQFTYGTALPAGTPYIAWLSTPRGIGGAWITLTGVNFSAASDQVLFGGVPTPDLNATTSNTTVLTVEVPPGVGNVSVQVESTVDSSPLVCGDRFDIVSPGPPPITVHTASVNLSASTDAVPLFTSAQTLSPFAGNGSVLATVGTSLCLYQVNGSTLISSTSIAALGSSLGSKIFTQIGSSEVTIPGGSPLEVSAAPDGNGIFVLATSDQDGRTILESLVWNGTSWSQPYFTTPTEGSATDPQVALAPFGDYYATWVDEGSGPPAVDLAVFSSSGNLVQTPTEVPGAGGASGNSVGTANLAVDPMGHPIVAWSLAAGSSAGSIAVWGDYESPASVVSFLQYAWGQMVPADFEDFGGPGIASFESKVASAIGRVSTDVNRAKWCGAEQNASNAVYTNITWLDSPPLTWGPPPANCHVYVGTHHNTILTDTAGTLDADFYLSVETEWLMESLGVGVMPTPSWNLFPSNNQGNSKWYQPDVDSSTMDYWGDDVSVHPETTGTNTLVLHPLARFQIQNIQSVGWGSGQCYSSTVADWPVNYVMATQVSDPAGSFGGVYSGSDFIPTPAFTNIYPDENGTYYANLTIQFATYNLTTDFCTNPYTTTYTETSTPVNWPTSYTFDLSGHFTTGLDPYPGTLNLDSVTNTSQPLTSKDSVAWQNTVDSTAGLWINGSSNDASWQNANYSQFENASGGQLANAPSNLSSISLRLQSTNASVPSSWWPQVDVDEVSQPSPVQTFTEGCTDSSVQSVPIWTGPGRGVSNLTSNSATFTWNSTVNTTGWVDLQEAGGSVFNVSSQILTDPNRTAYEYVVEARGLDSWGLYSVSYNVGTTSACKNSAGKTVVTVHSNSQDAGPQIQVPGVPALFEQDAPYDSVTHQGGGATLAWQVPLAFLNEEGTTFLNGSVLLSSTNSSINTTVYPLSGPLTTFTNYSVFGTNIRNATAVTYALNLTTLIPNNEYIATVTLNYSTSPNPHFVGTSSLSFWYERDTSDDGLTDWEKSYGWEVTTTSLDGTISNAHVTANPYAYATNGLVSDYLEKEFGLNPTTLDSAGSHMLDTWNLTFDLGSGSPTLPASDLFQYYYENSSYNFSKACQEYSPGGSCSLQDRGKTLVSNLSADSPTQTGDSTPWAASVRWTGTGTSSALSELETLMTQEGVGWLRATTGHWGNDRTVTVWGKLSWGANPLAQSTLANGLADGNQPDPLEAEVAQFNITSWWADLNSANDEAAPYLTVSSGSGGTGTVYYRGYGPSEGDNGNSNVSYSGPYVVSVPITASNQYVYYNLSINDATSGSTVPVLSESASVDLEGTTSGSLNHNQRNASLSGTVRVLRVGASSNTLLWAPANNTTLSNLPWGLKRYTAEPDFDLIVLNLTSAVTVSGVVGAEGGYSYSVSLSSGLNNLLVPRGAFLTSPLGQALINNTNETVPIPGGSGVTFHATDWSSRTERSGTNSPGNPNYIWVFSTTDQSQNGSGPGNFGGLPQNGAVEAGNESRQVQAVFWINVTSSGNGIFSSASAELDDLFGGLVLYASGNLSGNILPVTSALGTLGLPSTVKSALANLTLSNGGAYAPPQYQQPPPSPSWWQSVGSAIWNTLSGVAEITGLSELVSVVWNAVQAAAAYIGEAASWLSNHLGIGKLASQLVAGLKAIASAMEWALNQLLQLLVAAVRVLFSTVTNSVKALVAGYADVLSADSQPLWAEYNASQTLGGHQSVRFIDDLFGTPFLIALGISTLVAAAFVILQALSVGAEFVVNLLVGLLTTAVAGALATALTKLIPSSFLSTAMVSSAWSIYNLTGGGQHSARPRILAPPAGGIGNISGSAFGLLLGVVGVGVSLYQLGGDIAAGPDAVLLLKYAMDGYLSYVVAVPIVNLALDVLSVVLGLAALTVSGALAYLLNVLGLFVGAAGEMLGLALLTVPSLARTVKLYGMSNMVLSGELVGGVGTALSLASLALS